jgi:hypothetical protein
MNEHTSQKSVTHQVNKLIQLGTVKLPISEGKVGMDMKKTNQNG